MRRLIVLAGAAILLSGCVGLPFMWVEVRIAPDSPVLAERQVPARGNHDVIQLSQNDGSFTALVFQVQNNDIEISDCLVTYDNGDQERVPVRLVFRQDSRSHSIPIHNRGKHRIVSVEYTYRIVGNARNTDARVAVYGVR
jgi:hypothetical protein